MLGEVCPVVVSKNPFQGVESPSNGGPNYEALKVKCCLTVTKKFVNASSFIVVTTMVTRTSVEVNE